MAKKLCLVLSALSLIPAQVFGYGAYYYGSGQGTFSKGRVKSNASTTNRASSSRTTSVSRGGAYGGLYSSQSASVGSGRGLAGSGGLRGFGSGGFGTSAFGASATPAHTQTQTQTPTTSPQIEGARVLSPSMFTQSVAANPPPQYFSVPAGGLIAIDDNKAQSLTGVGVRQGTPDLPPGSSSSQSGGYGGTLYSGGAGQ